MFTYKTSLIKSRRKVSLLFIAAFVIGTFASAGLGQATSPTPEPDENLYNGYRLSSAFEFGWRWRSLDGNENKYRSDLNYKQGFRTFDTNIFMDTTNGEGKYFDSFLFTNTGWGSDPTGYTRFNMEKVGAYKFNGTVRRVSYFNNLATHALGQHTQNTKHTFGDFDFTLLPQSEKLRLTFGASFDKNNGPGMWNVRAYRDEFVVPSNTDSHSNDFRFGAEGKLWGFDWGLNQGFRVFKDRTTYRTDVLNIGNNPADTASITTFDRQFPVDGHGYSTQFNLHRTFAQKLDFTGRIIYTSTDTESSFLETVTGRDNANNRVILDQYTIKGDAKRPQTRADVGITYNVSNKFRISNTLSFDKFTVNGGENLFENLLFVNNAGTISTTRNIFSNAYRVNWYQRYTNTVEGDYQFGNRAAFHLGYRYTNREIEVSGLEGSITTNQINPAPTVLPTPSISSAVIDETEKNSTNSFFVGGKFKPVDNWVLFWDIEHGSADNVFSRLENYKFTNYRVRSRVSLKQVILNFSAISKDNTNPGKTFDAPPLPFGAETKSQVYSATADWDASDKFRFSGGYSYRKQDSTAVVRVIGGTPTEQGVSDFYIRDNYYYAEVAAKPHKRVSFFATYRYNKDNGQGSRVAATGVQNILSSYPMKMTTPEIRAAIRITRNVDWNVGYQYYKFDDILTPSQSYKAHLPFTSLRIYFGGRAADR